jgi:Raf kinase inhibitor-like YbhB/YbcL family protein
VRRVVLLSTAFILVMIGAGCRHDGRSLRDPGPGQDLSISTTALATDPAIVDGALVDDTLGDTLPPSDAPLTVTAPWVDAGPIDPRYTCDGLNVAPALSWSPAPEGTVEIAVTMEDLDNPDFTHWAIAGLQPQLVALQEDTVPLDAYQATNGVGDIGYTGPCPPAGSTHTYVFTVHYLSQTVSLTDGAPGGELIGGITSVEIASAEVNGTFSRL